MGKIELSVKINGRGLTQEEQQFIGIWLKILETVLDKELSFLMKERVDIFYKDVREVI